MSWDLPKCGDWAKSLQDTPDGLYEGLIGKVRVLRDPEPIPKDAFNEFRFPVYDTKHGTITWARLRRGGGKFFSPILFEPQSLTDIQIGYYVERLADFRTSEIYSKIRENWADEEIVKPLIAGVINEAIIINRKKYELGCSNVDVASIYPDVSIIDQEETYQFVGDQLRKNDEDSLFRLFSVNPAYGKTPVKFNPFVEYWYNPNDDKQEEINMPTKLGFKDLKLNLPKTYEDCFFVPKPKKIIYNNPCTIVLWEDGTKTICRVQKGQEFSEYYGYLACLAKKIYGTNGGVDRRIKSVREYGKDKKKKPETTDEFVSSDTKEMKV